MSRVFAVLAVVAAVFVVSYSQSTDMPPAAGGDQSKQCEMWAQQCSGSGTPPPVPNNPVPTNGTSNEEACKYFNTFCSGGAGGAGGAPTPPSGFPTPPAGFPQPPSG